MKNKIKFTKNIRGSGFIKHKLNRDKVTEEKSILHWVKEFIPFIIASILIISYLYFNIFLSELGLNNFRTQISLNDLIMNAYRIDLHFLIFFLFSIVIVVSFIFLFKETNLQLSDVHFSIVRKFVDPFLLLISVLCLFYSSYIEGHKIYKYYHWREILITISFLFIFIRIVIAFLNTKIKILNNKIVIFSVLIILSTIPTTIIAKVNVEMYLIDGRALGSKNLDLIYTRHETLCGAIIIAIDAGYIIHFKNNTQKNVDTPITLSNNNQNKVDLSWITLIPTTEIKRIDYNGCSLSTI